MPRDSEISDSAPLQDVCWAREVALEVFGDYARYQDDHCTGLVWGGLFPIPRGSALSVGMTFPPGHGVCLVLICWAGLLLGALLQERPHCLRSYIFSGFGTGTALALWKDRAGVCIGLSLEPVAKLLGHHKALGHCVVPHSLQACPSSQVAPLKAQLQC